MQITIPTPARVFNIRPDWANVYQFTDTGNAVTVIIPGRAAVVASPAIPAFPGRAAIPARAATPTTPAYPGSAAISARPAVAAVAAQPACQQVQFVLWSEATTPSYTTQNTLNNGAGYGNADLVNGITNYLNAASVPITP